MPSSYSSSSCSFLRYDTSDTTTTNMKQKNTTLSLTYQFMANKDQTIIVLEENPDVMKKYQYVAEKYSKPDDVLSIQDIVAIKNVSFPDLDIQNFMVAMHMANTYDLDPRAKEIWGWEKGGKITIVASNAGFLKIARKQPGFISIISNAVFPGDEFEMDMATGTVTKHIIHPDKLEANTVPLGAYTILRMEGKDPVTKWVYWNEYVQTGDYTPWKKQKSAMICKCSSSVLCREAFGLSGLYGEEEAEFESVKQKADKAKEALKAVVKSEGAVTFEEAREEPVEAVVEETQPEPTAQDTPNIQLVREYVERPDANTILKQKFEKNLKNPNYTEAMARKDLLLVAQA